MMPAPLPFQNVNVGSTANFTVAYETIDRSANIAYDSATLAVVDRRARAILAACEHDYAILCNWFGVAVGQGFGPTNRIAITLTTLFSNGGVNRGAYNLGYQHPSQIFANPYGSASDPTNDDVIMGLVVAELAEILMSQGGHWGPQFSDGEGLSRVASHLLRPAILSAFFGPAPADIRPWMTIPPGPTGWTNPFGPTPSSLPSHHGFRQDWVSSTPFEGENGVPGDGDWFSFGCAILFIYYLKDQLGYSMPQIVQSPGDTLEERYHALTGKTGGFAPFKAVLDAFYPQNAPLPSACDLFPLGGQHCRAALTTEPFRYGPPALVRTASAQRGTLCGPRSFEYSLYNLNDHLIIHVKTFGFGHPLYSWSIEGQPLPTSGSLTLTVSTIVIAQDPAMSSTPVTQNVTIHATVNTPPGAIGPSPGIEIQVYDNPGHVKLRVDVVVTDQYATGPDAVATSFVTAFLDTQQVDWDPAYERVSHECANRYKTEHNRPLPFLRRFLPDPPPYLLAAARELDHLRQEVHEVAERNPELARELDRHFGGILLSSHRTAPKD